MTKTKNPAVVARSRIKSAAKAKAPRENGKRAGRAPTFALGDRARANGQAPIDYRSREGFITEVGPGTSEFRLEFDDGKQPTTGYLLAGWLDRV